MRLDLFVWGALTSREFIAARLGEEVRFAEICLIDDSTRNMEAATQMGMQAIHFKDPGTIKAVLRRFGKK